MRKNHLVWLLAAFLVLVPALGALSPRVFAQDESSGPSATAAQASPVADDPTEDPADDATATPTATSIPDETATAVGTPASVATKPARSASVASEGTPNPAKLSDVTVSVDCQGNPETVTISNTGVGSFKVTEVRYLKQNRWYTKSATVNAGQSIVYKTGPAAGGSGVISQSYRFIHSAGEQDGARITTNLGQITRMCAPLPVKLADIAVSVSCQGNPETITILNRGGAAVRVTEVRFLKQNRWYTKNTTVSAGQTIVYKTGPAASGSGVLSSSYRFVHSAGAQDGARITTNLGQIITMCAPVPVKASDVRVSVDCLGNPETVSITNNGQASIKVTKVKYLYKDRWYAKDQTVRGGQTIVYKTGSKASGSGVISTNFMLVDSAGDRDGVRITTSVGDVNKYCKPLTGERWIDVNLSSQVLTAYQGNVWISSSYISSGKDGFETPTGTFSINSRYRYKDMAGCEGGECWYVPAVQYAQYFTYVGHAIHAATWHNDFGTIRHSHGCINLPLGYAAWLWDWSTYGTRVNIHY